MSILNSTKMPLNVSYKLAQASALIIAIILFLLSYIFGRDDLFLWFNTNLGVFADTFFSYFTYLAEGWILIPYLILVVGIFKKDALFIIINSIISTLLTQIPKQLIWPHANRPLASGSRPVPGVCRGYRAVWSIASGNPSRADDRATGDLPAMAPVKFGGWNRSGDCRIRSLVGWADGCSREIFRTTDRLFGATQSL